MKKEHNEQVQLPSGYRQLEYIESTGTQYIDLNLISTDSMSFSGTFIINSIANIYSGVCFSGLNYNTNDNFGVGFNNRFRHFIAYRGGVNNIRVQLESDNGDTVKVTLNRDSINVKNLTKQTEKTNQFSYSTIINPTRKLYLLKGNTNNADLQNISKFRILQVSIDEDNMIRNFIPALRKSDDKPGLYDLCGSICPLTGTPFYVNAGTGEFLYQ